MIISREYTLEAKTSLANKTEDKIKIASGTLQRVVLQSAPGVNGEVYARVIHFENSIVPDENDQWVPLTGTRQEYQLNYSDWNDVPIITIELCSPDTRFNHKINVELEIMEQETLDTLFKSFVQGGLKSQSQ